MRGERRAGKIMDNELHRLDVIDKFHAAAAQIGRTLRCTVANAGISSIPLSALIRQQNTAPSVETFCAQLVPKVTMFIILSRSFQRIKEG